MYTNKGRYEIAKWRWEFARRNKKYKEDYKKHYGKSKDMVNVHWKEDEQRKIEKYFLKKYCLVPINPNYSFDDLINIKQSEVFGHHLNKAILHLMSLDIIKNNPPKELTLSALSDAVLRTYLKENPKISPALILGHNKEFPKKISSAQLMLADEKGILSKYDGNIDEVCMEIDISASTVQIVKDIKRAISVWKKVYKRYRKVKEVRKRPYNYDKYLKIYDLKKSGKNVEEIAKAVYFNEYELGMENSNSKCNLNSLLKKVAASIKASEKLVEGKYRKIR